MERCLQCNATLTAKETECFMCGASVKDKNPKKEFSDRFRAVVNVLFIVFAILTIVSLFTDIIASFAKSASGLVVTYLVRNSAIHMFESSRKS